MAWSEAAPIGYRAVSSLAVVSLLLGLLSATALLDWSMAVVPVAGVLAGMRAWRTIDRNADALTGKSLAKAGIALSLVFWSAGWTRLAYEYATEVPEGFARLTFEELQPESPRAVPLVPPSASAFDGKRVFMKGYILPGRQSKGIKEFNLVWNSGDCCFGVTPTATHMVAVTLKDPLRLNYTTGVCKVAGTFHVEPGAATEGQDVVYRLDADYLQ